MQSAQAHGLVLQAQQSVCPWLQQPRETAAQELTLKRPNVYLIHTREALRVPTAYSFLLKSILGEFKLSNSMKANESLLGPFL